MMSPFYPPLIPPFFYFPVTSQSLSTPVKKKKKKKLATIVMLDNKHGISFKEVHILQFFKGLCDHLLAVPFLVHLAAQTLKIHSNLWLQTHPTAQQAVEGERRAGTLFEANWEAWLWRAFCLCFEIRAALISVWSCYSTSLLIVFCLC